MRAAGGRDAAFTQRRPALLSSFLGEQLQGCVLHPQGHAQPWHRASSCSSSCSCSCSLPCPVSGQLSPRHHTATCRGRPLSRGGLWRAVPGGFKRGTRLGTALSPAQHVSVPCAGMCGCVSLERLNYKPLAAFSQCVVLIGASTRLFGSCLCLLQLGQGDQHGAAWASPGVLHALPCCPMALCSATG